ncbi:MAG: sel1 repeat family protein [Gammaproteobacteria bacterium AqS3]|nr:sel1 repeat family protein [Gammaproteobacteria bacterium AqS3]
MGIEIIAALAGALALVGVIVFFVVRSRKGSDDESPQKQPQEQAPPEVDELPSKPSTALPEAPAVDPSKLREHKAAAQEGRAESQYAAGMAYLSGLGGERNPGEGAKLIRSAARQGYVEAQYRLGNLYLRGEGMRQDVKEAVRWIEKAARQDHAEAQYYMGLMCELGEGVDPDPQRAWDYFTAAANQGFAKARDKLERLRREQGEAAEPDEGADSGEGESGGGESAEAETAAASDAAEQPSEGQTPAAEQPPAEDGEKKSENA